MVGHEGGAWLDQVVRLVASTTAGLLERQQQALYTQAHSAPGWPASRHSGRSASSRGARAGRAGWPPASTIRPPRMMASCGPT